MYAYGTEVFDSESNEIGNFTGQEVVVLDGALYVPELKKIVGGTVAAVFPKHEPLNVIYETKRKELFVEGAVIPVYCKVCKDVEPLPKGFRYYIVTRQYFDACQILGLDTSKLLTTGVPVFDENKVYRGVAGLLCTPEIDI